MTVHAYRRVSSRIQVDNNSLDVQADKIARYANYKCPDHPIIDYVDPAVSASIGWFERPNGARLWANLMPGDHIVLATFDRAFRSVLDLCLSIPMLKEREVTVHFLDFGVDTSSHAGNMLMKMLAAVKEYERVCMMERVAAITEWKKIHKVPYGNSRPHGWKKAGKGREAKYIPWGDERRLGYFMRHLNANMKWSHGKIYLHADKQWAKNKLNINLSYGYIQRLITATKNGFPTEFGDKADVLPWEIEGRQPTPAEAVQHFQDKVALAV
jgi:DNA invertase Pin-like site-specific DNA recombinase